MAWYSFTQLGEQEPWRGNEPAQVSKWQHLIESCLLTTESDAQATAWVVRS